MEEVDRLEKKYEIGVMRETDQIKEFVNKTKMDVTGARQMITQSKSDSAFLDRI